MVKNISVSIKQQLLNLSRSQGWDFNWLLSRYANERLLYRIGRSPYADRLILKGALLFIYWGKGNQQATRDIDLLGYGIKSEEAVRHIFDALCALDVTPDGLCYDPASIRIAPIQQGQEAHGYRVHLLAYLGKGRIRIQVDVGAGDVVTPEPERIEFPTLLKALPAPQLKAYPQEVTIAEKTHAMIDKGLKNSRMKDFYDLWLLSQQYAFSGERLAQALRSTFTRKGMSIPEPIFPLTPEFGHHPEKGEQWKAFVKKNDLAAPNFPSVIIVLHDFLHFPLLAVREGLSFAAAWPPGGPWQPPL